MSTADYYNQESMMLISNITLEPYFSSQLQIMFENHKTVLRLSTLPYEDFLIAEKKAELECVDTILLWLDFYALFPDISNEILTNQRQAGETLDGLLEFFTDFINRLVKVCTARVIFFGFEDYSAHISSIWGSVYCQYHMTDRLNQGIYEAFSDRITVIDLKRMIAKNGILNSLDGKQKYRWGNPYSQALLQESAAEIYRQYAAAHGISRKCLVLDCDNVLWGGIFSEDGMKNLKLGELGTGKRFQDFQRFLLQLYSCGVMLAVSSKNDLDDVLTMFRKHDAMLLKEKHISCFEVNWNNKCDNLKKISELLNIGLDSMVFIDDSVFEIEAVRMTLPMVHTILYENHTIYENLNCFHISPNVTVQSVKIRNETYQSDCKRRQLKKECQTFEDYLKNLRVELAIRRADEPSLNRICELSQRTNKCTNGRRYTVNELKAEIEGGLQVFSVHVSDRFSNLGLVGVIGIQGRVLKLFCLSCRALGRKIEDGMLEYIGNSHSIREVNFIETSKNRALNQLLNHFLNQISDKNGQ